MFTAAFFLSVLLLGNWWWFQISWGKTVLLVAGDMDPIGDQTEGIYMAVNQFVQFLHSIVSTHPVFFCFPGLHIVCLWRIWSSCHQGVMHVWWGVLTPAWCWQFGLLICKPAFGLKLQQKEKFRYITCSGLAQFELLGHFLDYPFITLLSYSSAHYYFSLTPLHGSGGFLYAIA